MSNSEIIDELDEALTNIKKSKKYLDFKNELITTLEKDLGTHLESIKTSKNLYMVDSLIELSKIILLKSFINEKLLTESNETFDNLAFSIYITIHKDNNQFIKNFYNLVINNIKLPESNYEQLSKREKLLILKKVFDKIDKIS